MSENKNAVPNDDNNKKKKYLIDEQSETGNKINPVPGSFDIDDKLIGDDLEITKASKDSDPEIDTNPGIIKR